MGPDDRRLHGGIGIGRCRNGPKQPNYPPRRNGPSPCRSCQPSVTSLARDAPSASDAGGLCTRSGLRRGPPRLSQGARARIKAYTVLSALRKPRQRVTSGKEQGARQGSLLTGVLKDEFSGLLRWTGARGAGTWHANHFPAPICPVDNTPRRRWPRRSRWCRASRGGCASPTAHRTRTARRRALETFRCAGLQLVRRRGRTWLAGEPLSEYCHGGNAPRRR